MAETKKVTTNENWHRHLDRWQKSGLSQAEYCRRNDLSPAGFQWHKGKQKREGTAFVPVRLKGQRRKITIGIGDSVRVELLRTFNATELADLIRSLDSISCE